MNILIACEFSGIVRDAFRRKGHEAWSCDLEDIEPEGEWPNYHLFGDYRWFLDSPTKWDMLIGFPPCTHLAVSGARWFKYKDSLQSEALKFVKQMGSWEDISRIAIENPISVLSTKWRKPDQIIQPWQFGHGETKATCLWLKGLPKLVPTNIVTGRHGRVWREAPSPDRWKKRSRTYQGIADAMAEQWG